MLMIGVTLSVGGLVAAAALSQNTLAANSATLGGSVQQSSAGLHLGLAYAAVASSSQCPTYEGLREGTSLAVSLYNYGTTSFTPTEVVVNSTAYTGSFATISPGGLGTYTIALSSCSHSTGQAIVVLDSAGDEVQFGS
jgi:hypothetical protein